MRKHFDTNIKTGDVRFNRFSRHPALVVGDKISVHPIVGITHSNKTFGKDNFKITYNSYILSNIDFVSDNKINYLCDDRILSEIDKSNIFRLIKEGTITRLSEINSRKIK